MLISYPLLCYRTTSIPSPLPYSNFSQADTPNGQPNPLQEAIRQALAAQNAQLAAQVMHLKMKYLDDVLLVVILDVF